MTHIFKSLAVVALMAGPGLAQDAGEGAALFAKHCATCHGEAGTGDGPMAPALLLRPTNLTELGARNDGVFPMLRVVSRIDGTDPLVSHGSPMPVYGPFFEGVQSIALKTDAGQPVMISQPVADLVTYLREIQQ